MIENKQFNPNPPAKLRFQEIPDNISEHRGMIDSKRFQRAIDFTLLEYGRTLADGVTDELKAKVAGIKLQAVHEFIIVLKYLAEKPLPFSAPKIVDNLPDDSQIRRQ